MRQPMRLSNRGILLLGLLICIVAAVVAAYYLGFVDRSSTPS
jgi:hypothetical protein